MPNLNETPDQIVATKFDKITYSICKLLPVDVSIVENAQTYANEIKIATRSIYEAIKLGDVNKVEVPIEVPTPETSLDYIKHGVMEILKSSLIHNATDYKLSVWDCLSPFMHNVLTPDYINIVYKEVVTYDDIIKIRLLNYDSHSHYAVVSDLISDGIEVDY